MTSPENVHVSDDLAAYASRDLTAARRAEIDAHLAACEGCSQELAGVMALRAADFEPMTGPERERVTAGVRSAVTGTKPGVFERWGRRMAPALGAAAMVALAVVGYVSFNDEAADSPATTEASQDAAPETLDDAEGGTGQGAARSKAGPEAASESQAADTLEIESDAAAGSTTAFGSAGSTIPVVRERRFALSSLGNDLFAPRRMRDAFRAYDGTTLFAAEDPGIATTMDVCARTVVETSPYPVVPTYAAHFAADDVVVIAFVWRDETSGNMNFLLRGWRGGNCGSVSPIYRTGPL